ncbi:hypothetical protein FB45DRAFT_865732 [Roridomyces roridus]|uniref:Uncharacterized protein n=1 Tax=Roridomyces roridus TaxID=1738132 RepID=A0AAD7FS99_9AGAR|nr:hypothetical protein FB45DRAFT_865732 [Roridomyces roridus]
MDGLLQLPRRRLRSKKEYSPFDLALGLAIQPAVYFDAEEQLRVFLEEQQTNGTLDEPEDIIVPALSSLTLNGASLLSPSLSRIDAVLTVPDIPLADPQSSIPVAPNAMSGVSAAVHRKQKYNVKRAQRRQGASTSAASHTPPRDRLKKASSATAREKIKSKVKRDHERRLNPASPTNPKLKHVHLKRAREATSSPIHVAVDANDLPHSKPGWIGVRRGQDVNLWEYEDTRYSIAKEHVKYYLYPKGTESLISDHIHHRDQGGILGQYRVY